MAADAEPITIVLADDHAVVRTGLRHGARRARTGSRSSPRPATSTRRCATSRAHQPDVLVLDLNMPGEPSLPSDPALREARPSTAIVVLTMQDDPAFAREALRSGARGYVLKEAADAELVEAVRLAPRAARTSTRGSARGSPPSRRAGGPARRPHRARAGGPAADRARHTNTEIADQLYLSVRTVESHRAHIQQKLRPLHAAPSSCATRSTTG